MDTMVGDKGGARREDCFTAFVATSERLRVTVGALMPDQIPALLEGCSTTINITDVRFFARVDPLMPG